MIARAEKAGVVQMIVTGASLEGSRKAIELARSQHGSCMRPRASIPTTRPS